MHARKNSVNIFSLLFVVCVLVVLALAPPGARGNNDGLSIPGLREFATIAQSVEFRHVRFNPSEAGERREVVSFESDGLRQFALVLWPAGEKPATGWPVLLFNHGYHPNPPDYGKTAEGQNSRPGDYYRGVVQAFADNGYVVVTPDYRGHNDSEGAEYTSRVLADHWYTRDAIAAYFGLASLAHIDIENVYMSGHSMGGPITQRALLVLGERIRAASIWSGAEGRPLGRMMSREMTGKDGYDETGIGKPLLDQLAEELTNLNVSNPQDALSTKKYIGQLQVPLTIQHAKEDASTSVDGSLELAALLYLSKRDYQMFIYDSDDHLFSGNDFVKAVKRDLAWFAKWKNRNQH